MSRVAAEPLSAMELVGPGTKCYISWASAALKQRNSHSMKKDDAICPKCGAGFRRVELTSMNGTRGDFRCPVCDFILETSDGSTEVAYRLTIVPSRILD